eukprot:scaffold7127_cov156-Isochrysis_galbana.AAC.4
MANHQAGQGQGSKGEPLAFLCAQVQPPGMPMLNLWPWWTHNCVRRQDQQALARQPQPTHRLSGAQTTPTEPITSGLTIPTLAVGATRSWEQPHTCTPLPRRLSGLHWHLPWAWAWAGRPPGK